MKGTAIVRLSGEVDISTAPRVKQEITDLLDQGYIKLLVHLDEVDYLDSTGLAVLLSGLRRAMDQGGHLGLICSRPSVLRILEISGLDRIFTLYPNETDALEQVL
jgi:anti-sigma B factor antagonist